MMLKPTSTNPWATAKAEISYINEERRSGNRGWERIDEALGDAGYWDGASLEDIGHRAAELITALQAERRWVPVEERLPEAESQAMVVTNYASNPVCAWFDGNVWTLDLDEPAFASVTHWMPLPKPPEATDAD